MTPIRLTSEDGSSPFESDAGGTTTLDALQRRGLMLLYFGYTHCPDICPATMADIAIAVREIPVQLRAHTQVVFMTSDPSEDTAPVLRTWLRQFDHGLPAPFVGLRASVAEIDRVATSVGVPIAPPEKDPNGTVSVTHGAEVLGFLNGTATLAWLDGATSDDYAHDITALLESPSN